ncbi:hypothetical protein C8A05DRAFT_35366 [Staphylotrichum tortipilum]|uniref:Uncharacterized protein n=1 Tax=Staphylotrichum tortipilum TaxID=2831512 RepID=A0AAN6RRR0_9PEZI|nr:hypothetical protein C8A05DRAFT_35366 [Staphylotrichum longicolle]
MTKKGARQPDLLETTNTVNSTGVTFSVSDTSPIWPSDGCGGSVANDDVGVALLLIADHGADIHVLTSTGKSMQTLMEENGCLNVRKAFPPEFWQHELPPPRRPNAFGDFNSDRVPNHLKKGREDWSVVFNQTAPRVLDVDLVHTLKHNSYELGQGYYIKMRELDTSPPTIRDQDSQIKSAHCTKTFEGHLVGLINPLTPETFC